MKIKLFIIVCLCCLLVCSCNNSMEKPESNINAIETTLKNMNISSYSSLNIMYVDNESSARSLTKKIYGYSKEFQRLELLDFSAGDIDLSSFEQVGNDYIIFKYNDESVFLFRISTNEVYVLTGIASSSSQFRMTDDGLIFTGMTAAGNTSIYSLDLSTETIKTRVNGDYETGIQSFYASKSGHLLVGDGFGESSNAKFYPVSGAIPSESPFTKTRLFNCIDHGATVGSQDSDIIIFAKKKYSLSDTGITLEEDLSSQYSCSSFPIQTQMPMATAYCDKYDIHDGFKMNISENSICVVEIVGQEAKITNYNIPSEISLKFSEAFQRDSSGNPRYTYNILYYNDYIVFTNNQRKGLYCFNYKDSSPELKTIYDGSIVSWDINGSGVVYTKYITAVDFETDFYDLQTGTTEKLCDGKAQIQKVVKIDLS